MFCHACGKPLGEDWNFCRNCGCAIELSEPPKPEDCGMPDVPLQSTANKVIPESEVAIVDSDSMTRVDDAVAHNPTEAELGQHAPRKLTDASIEPALSKANVPDDACAVCSCAFGGQTHAPNPKTYSSGKLFSLRAGQSARLYSHSICGKCWSQFHWRRVGARLLDLLISAIMMVGSMVLIAPADNTIVVLVGLMVRTTFEWTKDGWFSGRSPGKMVFGVYVIDRDSGRPASLAKCVKRNLAFVAFPWTYFLAIAIAANGVSKPPGIRIGDKWAGTEVVPRQLASFADDR